MAITDLTNTKWIFNDTLNFPSDGFDYSINFQSNNQNFSKMQVSKLYPNDLKYVGVDSSNTLWPYEGSWMAPLYKTITISGGTDATNSTLITWLEANATLVPSLAGTIWKFNWTLDMTTYDWNTWNINFTAPYAGDSFKTLALIGIRTEGDYNPVGTDRLYYISSNGLLGVYSNTEMTYKWQNSGARVIFISGGNDVYSDTLRDFLESNATQLFLDNISDLTNTTWEFYNDLAIPSYSSQTTYNLDFTCNFNGTEITCNKIIVPSNGAQINYYCTSPQEWEDTISGVFSVASGWQEDGFRTIKITGGSNAATAAAIQFIQINAKQVFTYTTTDKELGSIADAIREKGNTSAQLVYPAGFISAIQDIQGGDIYESIYKSLAYRSVIASSAPGVSEWCNSLSNIYSFQFAGQSLSGNFIFSNASFVGQYAFAWNYIGGFTGGVTAYNLTFPILSRFNDNSPFAMNRGLTSIYCPSVTTIGSYIFCSCYSLTTISFPSCTSISGSAFSNCRNLTTASFPECTTISNNAFYNCSNLITISFPKCTSIGSYAFYSCSKLTSIYFPSCTSISGNAFYNCYSLVTISFPECTTISSYAFYNCSNLITISFPKCTSIGSYAFYNCSKLTTVSFPSCTSISGSAFQNCSGLTTISFPKCTSIGSYAFQSCSSLTSMSFPSCTSIGNQTFQNCSSLTTISFPECATIGDRAFSDCRNLTTASFSKCTSIGAYAFYYCTSLSQIYFMGNLIPLIGTNIFAYTPMSLSTYLGYFGSIYVPSSLLASYKTATGWAAYSSRMVGI